MSGHDHDDYQSEPVRGLPERLPVGETMLWQGEPSWWQMSKDVFHVRAVAIYFAGLMAWRAHARMANSGGLHAALASVLSLLPFAAVGLSLLLLLAFLTSRATVYTITNRRIVIRAGIAITFALNIPFKLIGGAGLRETAGGHGNIALTILGDERIGYGTLWPHVRPGHLSKPQPMLRCIPNAAKVAAILTEAVRDAAPASAGTLEFSPAAPRLERHPSPMGNSGTPIGIPA